MYWEYLQSNFWTLDFWTWIVLAVGFCKALGWFFKSDEVWNKIYFSETLFERRMREKEEAETGGPSPHVERFMVVLFIGAFLLPVTYSEFYSGYHYWLAHR